MFKVFSTTKLAILICILGLSTIINGNQISLNKNYSNSKSRLLESFENNYDLVSTTFVSNMDTYTYADDSFLLAYQVDSTATSIYFKNYDTMGDIDGSPFSLTVVDLSPGSIRLAADSVLTYVAYYTTTPEILVGDILGTNSIVTIETGGGPYTNLLFAMCDNGFGAIVFEESSTYKLVFLDVAQADYRHTVAPTNVPLTGVYTGIECNIVGSAFQITLVSIDSANQVITIENYIDTVSTNSETVNFSTTNTLSAVSMTRFVSDDSFLVVWYDSTDNLLMGQIVPSDFTSITIANFQVNSNSAANGASTSIKSNADGAVVMWSVDATDFAYRFIDITGAKLTLEVQMTTKETSASINSSNDVVLIFNNQVDTVSGYRTKAVLECLMTSANINLIKGGASNSSNTIDFDNTSPSKVISFTLESTFAATECGKCIGYYGGISLVSPSINFRGDSYTLTAGEYTEIESDCTDGDCVISFTLYNRCFNNMSVGVWTQVIDSELSTMATASFSGPTVGAYEDDDNGNSTSIDGGSPTITLVECNAYEYCLSGANTWDADNTAGDMMVGDDDQPEAYTVGSQFYFQIYTEDASVSELTLFSFTYELNGNSVTVDSGDVTLSSATVLSNPIYMWTIPVSTNFNGSSETMTITVVANVNPLRRLLADDESNLKSQTDQMQLVININNPNSGMDIGIILAIVFGCLLIVSLIFGIFMWTRKSEKQSNSSKITTTERSELEDNNHKIEMTI